MSGQTLDDIAQAQNVTSDAVNRTFGNIATPIKAVIPPTVAWYRANPK